MQELTSCTLCGSTNLMHAINDVPDIFGSHDERFKYDRCQNCKVLILNPRVSESEISSYYSDYYTHSENKRRPLYRILINQILLGLNVSWRCVKVWAPNDCIPHLFGRKRKNILDFGCGSGSNLFFLKALRFNVCGFETDENLVKKLRDLGLRVYDDIDDVPEELDGVILNHVIEHVYDPLTVISKLSHKLKVNGLIYIATPSADSGLLKVYKNYWRGLEAPRHLYIFTFESILKVLSDNGFEAQLIKTKSPEKFMQNESDNIAKKFGSLSPMLETQPLGDEFIEVIGVKK